MIFYQRAFNAMGSPCDIQLFAATHRLAERVANLAIADVERLEQRYSR
jgi:thiamine biosynthesis lipoprotein